MDEDYKRIATTLASKGYSRWFIFPVWYRAHRALGIRIPLPVLMNVAEHYYYVGVQSALILVICYAVMSPLGFISEFPIALLIALLPVIPFMSWYRYRKARRDLKSEGLLS